MVFVCLLYLRIMCPPINDNDVVLDCCMGSGSTGVAAMNLNRRFIGIEKEPKYFEMASTNIQSTFYD